MLALDLYLREGPNAPMTSTQELSDILRAIPIEQELAVNASFRSEASVRQKLGNFIALDPASVGGLANGSAIDNAVWNEFHNKASELAVLAARIKATILSRETEAVEPEPDLDEATEGTVLTRLHQSRERNRRLVKRKKESVMRSLGVLTCEACGFDFASRYGAHGAGFIECHHRTPLSTLDPATKTTLDDLALVCANCHRMLHRHQPWLTVEELAQLLAVT